MRPRPAPRWCVVYDEHVVATRQSAGGITLNLLLFVFLVLAVTEVLLRVPPLFGRDLAMPERDPNRSQVLCVGDSFTEGGSVAEEERYPAQLQGFLDREQPETWATVNLGFTGRTSAYMDERLSEDLRRYQPEVVVLWAGGNMDTRMLGSEPERSSLLRSIDRALGRLELYRFVRVTLDDRARDERGRELTEAAAPESSAKTRNQELAGRFAQAQARERAFVATTTEAERQSLLDQDFRSMIEKVRAAGARLVFVLYPVELGNHKRANATMRALGAEYGIPVVSSWDAAQRVPEPLREWHWGMHPSEPIYRELVEEIGPLVLQAPASR